MVARPADDPNVVDDPQDDYLVALELAVEADVLVSVDKDLLELEIEGLTICPPVVFPERQSRPAAWVGGGQSARGGQTP